MNQMENTRQKRVCKIKDRSHEIEETIKKSIYRAATNVVNTRRYVVPIQSGIGTLSHTTTMCLKIIIIGRI